MVVLKNHDYNIDYIYFRDISMCFWGNHSKSPSWTFHAGEKTRGEMFHFFYRYQMLIESWGNLQTLELGIFPQSHF